MWFLFFIYFVLGNYWGIFFVKIRKFIKKEEVVGFMKFSFKFRREKRGIFRMIINGDEYESWVLVIEGICLDGIKRFLRNLRRWNGYIVECYLMFLKILRVDLDRSLRLIVISVYNYIV